jgi:CheY-like chemotaxis protein
MPTLLLAAESPSIRRLVELTFAGTDVTVVTAIDGEEAIRRLAAERPSIVLADIDLPGRNGYELTASIKHDRSRPAVPVVLLAGALDPVDDERATRAACDGLLVKPLDPATLRERVAELLGDPSRARVVEPQESQVLAETRRPGIEAPASTSDGVDDYLARLDAALAARVAEPVAQPPAAVVGGEGTRLLADDVIAQVTQRVTDHVERLLRDELARIRDTHS